MQRNIEFAPGEYYHLYNRGVKKHVIFRDARDHIRFLLLLLYYQSSALIHRSGSQVSYYIKNRKFNVTKKKEEEILENRSVELVSFAMMPNHFHLIVRELTDNGTGISNYMKRILGGYAKYSNVKYDESGHVFQGSFKAVHIESNEQLLYLSAYIHKNPREINKWKNKEDEYQWSSYQDFIGENRWGKLLSKDIVMTQFDNDEEYKEFVATSSAKEG